MRFLKNGPSIPDELLTARDEGRVIFFCGSGVSKARAGLADFIGLADDVIKQLKVTVDSPVCKVLKEAKDIQSRTEVSGLISADRIFGLLDREFFVSDIESAVARVLQPLPDVDLSAHRILLDLATTPEGKIRLVTTNFDRLFEDCDSEIQIWQPPRLPDPSRHDEMNGIIYLHGCTNKDYSGSEGDGFILSTSKFGRAYLTEGWATKFVREILERYMVVFVGYSADEPPVQYLLEALNKKEEQLNGIYAFQSGTSNEAFASWRQKGVEAIVYAEEDGHRSLWETLEAWASRARAPDEWYQSVIDLASSGPESLQPHERGQVAHIISTLKGARNFSESIPPPPSEWLCVIDPNRRYAKPGRIGNVFDQGPFIDPFNLYGLDSDIVPNEIDPDDHYAKRDIPEEAWDGFAANRLDLQNLQDQNFLSIRGYWAINPLRPSPRLHYISKWFSKVSEQATAVWWAASQTSLHPHLLKLIKRELSNTTNSISTDIHKAWHYLFESWEEKVVNQNHDWHELKAVIDKDGWSSAVIRKYATINRPYLKVQQNFQEGPIPPKERKDFQAIDLLRIDIEYPDPPRDAEIPDEWLSMVVRELRKNIEHAVQLENELGGVQRNLCPIIPDEKNDDYDERLRGLSGCVISFVLLFEQLIELDISTAHQEFSAWPTDGDNIFERLKIWVCGKSNLISAKTFGEIYRKLSDEDFWDDYHQRDLMLVLSKRWNELSNDTRKEIEERLIKGRNKWDGEECNEFEKSRAWGTLNRITWLASNNCHFTFDLEGETNRLKQSVPDWQPDEAVKAADSTEIRGGFVKTDTGYSLLSHEPLSSIISKASEMSGRSDDFLVENDPFSGFLREKPVRAFSALTYLSNQNEFPDWAWRKFLNSEARKNDKPKFSALIAERIIRYPDKALSDLMYPISSWFLDVSTQLATHFAMSFQKGISKLINVNYSLPPERKTAIIRSNNEADWTMEAINAPVGKIAQALFNDPRKDNLKADTGFPSEWLVHVENLLLLSGEIRNYAIVIFSHNLNWFYSVDSNWTEANLLSLLKGSNEDDREAFWSGFLWGSIVPNQKLYIQMKPEILVLAKDRNLAKLKYHNVSANIVLAGWGTKNEETKERFVSNDEMRDVLLRADDDFRYRILWQLENWTRDTEISANKKWQLMLPEFLRDVWPRQKSVKTSTYLLVF